MKVSELMNRNVTTIKIGSTMREAAEIFSRSLVSDLMVVDDEGCFVGVLSEGDLLRVAMPRFDELIGSMGMPMIESFSTFVEQGQEQANKPIDSLVIRNPKTFGPDDDALKLASAMLTMQVRRLPIIEEGRLIGSVARSDVALAVFKN